MTRTSVAAAVAAAFTVSIAHAQPSNVTIYGNAQIDFQNVRAGNGLSGANVQTGGIVTDAAQRNRVANLGNTIIGFRGTESIGGGVSVIWQIEQNIGGMDGTGGANTWGSRNTNLGLAGGFGTVFMGNWDTPFKMASLPITFPFGLTGAAGATNILFNSDTTAGNGGFAPNANTAFSRRANNSVSYWSPVVNGLQARVLYSANEERSETVAVVPQRNPSLWSGSLVYTGGPWRVGAAYERHREFNGANLNDYGVQVHGQYMSGPVMAGVIYERLSYDVSFNGAVQDLSRDAWMLVGQYTVGGVHRFRAQFQKAGNASNLTGITNATPLTSICRGLICPGNAAGLGGATGSGAQQWSVGYAYVLSKRTEAYGYYSRLDNEAGGRYDPVRENAIVAGRGSDATILGVGMLHRF